MARPYSTDLRERVVAAVASGQACRPVAELFSVSVSSVVKWSQRWRTTGSVAAKPMGGRKLILLSERDWLLGRLAESPDVTLRALQAELAERGVVVSHNAIWKLFAAEGISFKKKPARQRAGSSGRRPAPSAVAEASGPS
jgi:transposase